MTKRPTPKYALFITYYNNNVIGFDAEPTFVDEQDLGQFGDLLHTVDDHFQLRVSGRYDTQEVYEYIQSFESVPASNDES